MKADKEEMTRLSTDKKKQFVRLLFVLIDCDQSGVGWTMGFPLVGQRCGFKVSL